MRRKDIGHPTVTSHTLPATPELVAQNRERLRSVCESAMCEILGKPVEVTIDWKDAEHKTTT